MSKPILQDDDDIDFYFDEEADAGSSPYCEFLTGAAGTGKSYEINRRLDADPLYALVCATTGIAAINLGEGVTTVNAALGYFDTESLIDSYISGRLTKRLRKIADLGYSNIVIDEVSMMAAEQLDIITRALDNIARYKTVKEAMGLILTGDFCQLPPIKARWAFESKAWERFAANTVKLTKCWRQANGDFQAALVAMRRGNGNEAAQLMQSCGAQFAQINSLDFPGTTIMSKNDEVDRFNWICHNKVQGRVTSIESVRWGKQKGEWKLIPLRLDLKIGAYVMILANHKANQFSTDYLYVNGDCGHIVDFDQSAGAYIVRLKRNGSIVTVNPITRRNEQKEKPTEEIQAAKQMGGDIPFYDSERKRWVIGTIEYAPLRLAYATTAHKSQGLSLDSVQVNLSNAFFGSPAMAYVALSRCRTPEGLRIVGSKELLAKRVCTDPKVIQFL